MVSRKIEICHWLGYHGLFVIGYTGNCQQLLKDKATNIDKWTTLMHIVAPNYFLEILPNESQQDCWYKLPVTSYHVVTTFFKWTQKSIWCEKCRFQLHEIDLWIQDAEKLWIAWAYLKMNTHLKRVNFQIPTSWQAYTQFHES